MDDTPHMAKEDRSESLRNEVQELKEEAAALADRAKKAARHAEVLVERIKHLARNPNSKDVLARPHTRPPSLV
jgi:FtsZ-binding cell division protein ZapB